MASYCVTGGTGFLGAPVVQRLVDGRHRVRLLALPGTADRGGAVEVVAGGLDDPDAVREAVEGVDCVLHMAGALPEASRRTCTT